MLQKFTKHDDIQQLLTLKITQIMDPNNILAIYDEPDTSSTALVLTAKLFSQKNLLAQSSQGIIKMPNENVYLTEFNFPLSIQDLPPDVTLSICI